MTRPSNGSHDHTGPATRATTDSEAPKRGERLLLHAARGAAGAATIAAAPSERVAIKPANFRIACGLQN